MKFKRTIQMMMRWICVVAMTACVGMAATAAEPNWPQFRGPGGQGHAPAGKPPITWSERSNITWKTPIPGQGWSSPVVWGDHVWMTTATDEGRSRRAICVDKNTGRILHNIELFQVNSLEKINPLNSYASPTPTIEEGRVYITFGSVGTVCLDTATGKELWRNTDLKIEHSNGAGSSPVLYKDMLIMHLDGTDEQYVAALDKKTGKVRWRTHRSVFKTLQIHLEMKKAYCVPLIVEVGGREQMISVGAQAMYGYDPMTGKELWIARFKGYSNVPRPVVGDGMVFISTGYDVADLLAFKLGGTGDVTRNLAWKYSRGVPKMSSPLYLDGRLYFVADNGIAVCLNAKTGEEIWKGRVGGLHSASLLYAGGHIYMFDYQQGRSYVLKPGDKLEVVAENTLDAGMMATPAVLGDAFIARTKTHLYRIEKPGTSAGR